MQAADQGAVFALWAALAQLTAEGAWSNELIAQLQAYECDPVLQFKMRSLLTSLTFSRSQALQAQQQMRRFVAATPELRSRCGMR